MISTFCRADRLRLATLFQSREEARYYLNGVCIQTEGNGVRLSATDGYRVAMFKDDAGFTSATCIIPIPKVVCQLIKAAKMRDRMWFAVMGEHSGTGRRECRLFNDDDAQLGELASVREAIEDVRSRGIVWAGPIDLIDGTFPNVGAAVPEKRATHGHCAAFQAKFLADFGQVAGDLQRQATGPLRIYQAKDEPALIDCGRSDFVGVLMPMRSDPTALVDAGSAVQAPAWATRHIDALI